MATILRPTAQERCDNANNNILLGAGGAWRGAVVCSGSVWCVVWGAMGCDRVRRERGVAVCFLMGSFAHLVVASNRHAHDERRSQEGER